MVMTAACFEKNIFVHHSSDVIRQNGTDSSSRAQNHAPDVGAGGDAPAGSLTFAERHLVDLYGFKWPSDSQEVGEFLDALKIRRR